MRPARIRPVIVKEFRQIRRDRRTLGVLVLVPAFLLIMYGYALDLDVQRLPTAVYDADNSTASRDLLSSLFLDGHSEQFRLIHVADAPGAIDSLLLSGGARVGIIIPPGFSATLAAGRRASVQVLVDGVMASTAATAVGYVEAIFQQYSFDIIENATGGAIVRPVDYRPRIWYNPELKSDRFLIPGLIAFILLITTTVATSLSIVRERELGSIEQMQVSPLRASELIVGKLIPYTLISLLSTALVLVASVILFGMPIMGSFFLLFVGTTLYLAGALGLGLLISTVVRTQEAAFLIAALATLLPTFVLSGFVFPISNMPVAIQAITYVVPARYFLVVLRAIMLKGVGLEAFWDQLLFLAGFATLMLVVGTLRLRKIVG